MKEQSYQSILDTIKNARVVFIEFKEKKYLGRLLEGKPGEKMLFTVPKVDSYLASKVQNGELVAIRLILADGNIVAFESELIEKKLPKLILKFPEKETDKYLRSTTRSPAKLRAKIIIKSAENATIESDISTVGTIQNLSDTGCSVTAGLNLEIYNIINLAITVPLKSGDKVFELRGNIQRKKTGEDGKNNYGIAFFDNDIKILSGIRRYVENQNQNTA